MQLHLPEIKGGNAAQAFWNSDVKRLDIFGCWFVAYYAGTLRPAQGAREEEKGVTGSLR